MNTSIIIKDFCEIKLSEHPDKNATTQWIDEVVMLGTAPGMFECGLDLWYELLPALAARHNLNHEQLQFCMASVNALDKVEYAKERWMPEAMKRGIILALKAGITIDQLEDYNAADDLYAGWLKDGLLD